MTSTNIIEQELVEIEKARIWVEQQYVGFSPSTSSVKPVHIANGLYRTVQARTYDTKWLNRGVFVSTQKGQIPKGHKLEEVYEELQEHNGIDSNVSSDDLMKLRKMLYEVLNSDNAVYNDGMESYSAGYQAFVSNDRIGQDGGEFFALWISRYAPELHTLVKQDLTNPNDIITALAAPFLSSDFSAPTRTINEEQLACFSHASTTITACFDGLANAAKTLHQHISTQDNKLLRLRQVVLFACFVLARHLSWLEHYYVPNTPPTIMLLDFSSRSDSAVARASQLSYNRICQSICRFYIWAFENYLRREWRGGAISAAELATAHPSYKRKTSAAARQYWRLAAEDADTTAYAQAIYDILAMEAESNPINYLRQLGIRSGLMLPVGNRPPIKRFAIRQDMLEMLVCGAVTPGESVTMNELLDLFWRRYGIIVGGRSEDEARLLVAGIYQADSEELQQNARNFALRLQDLSFARMLADGVLEVRVGGSNAA